MSETGLLRTFSADLDIRVTDTSLRDARTTSDTSSRLRKSVRSSHPSTTPAFRSSR